MVIEADPTLNGKIVLDIDEISHQKVTIYQLPRNFNNQNYQGIFPNNQIFREVKAG